MSQSNVLNRGVSLSFREFFFKLRNFASCFKTTNYIFFVGLKRKKYAKPGFQISSKLLVASFFERFNCAKSCLIEKLLLSSRKRTSQFWRVCRLASVLSSKRVKQWKILEVNSFKFNFNLSHVLFRSKVYENRF